MYGTEVAAVALLKLSLVKVTELKEEVTDLRDEDDSEDDGRTMLADTVVVMVDDDAAVEFAGDKVNSLEKDVVEIFDEGIRRVNGGFPGPFPIAPTEPICVPCVELVELSDLDRLDDDIVGIKVPDMSEDAEADIVGCAKDDCVEVWLATLEKAIGLVDVGMNDVRTTFVVCPVAELSPSRPVTMVSILVEDVAPTLMLETFDCEPAESANEVLWTSATGGTGAVDERRASAIELLDEEVSAATDEVKGRTVGSELED